MASNGSGPIACERCGVTLSALGNFGGLCSPCSRDRELQVVEAMVRRLHYVEQLLDELLDDHLPADDSGHDARADHSHRGPGARDGARGTDAAARAARALAAVEGRLRRARRSPGQASRPPER
jgi:hypothetical protein